MLYNFYCILLILNLKIIFNVLYIIMNITDISFHHIHIQPPKSEDDKNYYFPLHYTNEYTKPCNILF